METLEGPAARPRARPKRGSQGRGRRQEEEAGARGSKARVRKRGAGSARRPPSRGASPSWLCALPLRSLRVRARWGARVGAGGKSHSPCILTAPRPAGLGMVREGAAGPAQPASAGGRVAGKRRPLSFRFAFPGQASSKNRTATRALAERSRPEPPRATADPWARQRCGQVSGASPERAETRTPGAEVPQRWRSQKYSPPPLRSALLPPDFVQPGVIKRASLAGESQEVQTLFAGVGREPRTTLHQPAP